MKAILVYHRDARKNRKAATAVLQHLARHGYLVYIYGSKMFLNGTDEKRDMLKLNKRLPCLKTLPVTFGTYESFDQTHIKISVDDYDRVGESSRTEKSPEAVVNRYFRDAHQALLNGDFSC